MFILDQKSNVQNDYSSVQLVAPLYQDAETVLVVRESLETMVRKADRQELSPQEPLSRGEVSISLKTGSEKYNTLSPA